MNKTLLPVSIFAIAMGFLESAVVVYLRTIYYPEGFDFPLKTIEGTIAFTEILREAATMIMLVTVAVLSARRWLVRFAWFIYMFAIWDIFYYVFLWALLAWPESLFTWDILFLIPVPWVGPVLAPVINSLTMILLAVVIIRADQRTGGPTDKGIARNEVTKPSGQVRLTGLEWGLLAAGSLVTILAYTLGYSTYMLQRFSLTEWISLSDTSGILERAGAYVPVSFNWWLFSSGTVLFLISIVRFVQRYFSSPGE